MGGREAGDAAVGTVSRRVGAPAGRAAFDRLVGQAAEQEQQDDLTGAAATLRQALDLWRGPLLADLECAYFDRLALARQEQRMPRRAWQLAWTLATFLDRRANGMTGSRPSRSRLPPQHAWMTEPPWRRCGAASPAPDRRPPRPGGNWQVRDQDQGWCRKVCRSSDVSSRVLRCLASASTSSIGPQASHCQMRMVASPLALARRLPSGV